MLGRPFRVDWHPQDTPEALKAAYRAERDSVLRTRLHALWLLRSKHRIPEVSRVVGVDYRTVQKWVRRYREGGLAEALSRKKTRQGQGAYLSEEAEREVVAEVATGRFRTGQEIRDWIASEYCVHYKRAGIYGLLRRLGCSPKAPRPLHAKADLEQQAAWKKGALRKPSGRLG